MDRVNKRDIIDLVSERANLTKADAKDTVEAALQLIEDALVAGKEVNLSNFGVLVPITRKTRIGTDPKKHTKITIEKTRTISLRVAKSFKSRLNSK